MVFRKNKKPRKADTKQVFDYACWLLGRRNYSQAELLEKFNNRFIPDEKIFSVAIKKLKKLGLQSDENFAESFVSLHKEWGRQRLQFELKRRGIEDELIAKFLPSEFDELDRCQSVLKIKLKNYSIPEDYKEKQKLIAFLAKRGFSLDVIKIVFQHQ